MSHFFYIGLSFCFMACRTFVFVKNYKKSQKLPVFGHKIKTGASLKKNLDTLPSIRIFVMDI